MCTKNKKMPFKIVENYQVPLSFKLTRSGETLIFSEYYPTLGGKQNLFTISKEGTIQRYIHTRSAFFETFPLQKGKIKIE